jgi:hypothetical protein
VPQQQAQCRHAHQAVRTRDQPEDAKHQQQHDEGHADADRRQRTQSVHRKQWADKPDRQCQQHHGEERQHLPREKKCQKLFEVLHA